MTTKKREFIGVNPKLIHPISDEEQEKRGWAVEVNGEVIPTVSEVRLFNEGMGLEVRYGMRSEGYDGVLDHEPEGGGSVIVPYAIVNGLLYVGLLRQLRATQSDHGYGSPCWNVPRGYLDPGETHFDTASREFKEETGFKKPEKRIKELPGKPVNCNSARFDTSRGDEGIRFFRFEVMPEELKEGNFYEDDSGGGLIYAIPTLEFDRQMISAISKSAEKIIGCYFLPWHQAALVGDLFTRGIVATLKAVLEHPDETRN